MNEGTISSPFLEWTFADAPARVSNQKLEIRDASGQSLRPAVEFTTDGKAKSFTVSATKNTGYTLWLGDMQTTGYKQLIDAEGTTVFKATDDKLFSFSGMKTLPSNWSEYAQTAKVGPTGADVSVSDNTHYTVHTSAGLAWIAWVTNEGKNNTAEPGKSYPAEACFKGCTVTLNNDIALTTPTAGVASNFNVNWPTIGNAFGKYFQGTFNGDNYTVSGLSITSFSGQFQGLFGYIQNAVIKNLRVKGNINGTDDHSDTYVGGIVGYLEESKIIACSNAVEIALNKTNGKLSAGGIVGFCSGRSAICSSCWNEASVSGTNSHTFAMGGIVGRSDGALISNCYSSGRVSGTGSTNEKGNDPGSGGIVGYMMIGTISNCYATGSVSATNSKESGETWAGGIAGFCYISTVSNSFALNTGSEIKISAIADTPYIGRIVGENFNGNISDNAASPQIMLQKGSDPAAAPTTEIGTDSINGASLYLDEAVEAIKTWAGPENTKAFTAIGTDPDGKLPQLKAIDGFGTNGLPVTYGNSAMADQLSFTTSDYLALLTALKLPASSPTITLSFSDGKWSYQKEGGAPTRFTGTVKMAEGVNKAETSIVVSTATGKPTLTFENVYLNSTFNDLLTINNGCVLTLHAPDKPLHLTSGDSYGLINRGTLRVTGKGLSIEKANPTNYGFDNYGIFMVPDLAETSVTIFGNGQTMKNSGTLDNAWIEWQFESYPGKIAFAATDDTNQSPNAHSLGKENFATPVTPGKTYRLWKVTGDSPGEVRTRQTGKKDGKTVSLFPAPAANEVAVYANIEDAKTVTITDSQNFSQANCSENNVIVKAGGVLTVDTASAIVLNLKLEEDGQVVTTNALKVDETFSTTRTLDNQWIAFGSPVAMKASVGEAEGQLLYLGIGYTDSDPLNQCWKNVSGFPDTGKKTADLAADSPYLLAAEEPPTPVSFVAEASPGQPVEIPATATVTLGADLPNGQFLFRTNPNLSNLTLSNIYVLNAEGTLFELQTGSYQVKPFEAYVAANAVTCSRIRSLRIGKEIPTGIEQPLAAGTRIWGTRGRLHISADAPAHIVVVTPAGHTVRTFQAAVGDTTLTLPEGIYFVRCNDITYKVSL